MKNEFIENMIFENEKDKCFGSSSLFYLHLSMKYKIKDTRKEIYSNLYRRIINYQVNKYGCSLNFRDRISSEENIHNARKVYDSHKQAKKRKRKVNEEN